MEYVLISLIAGFVIFGLTLLVFLFMDKRKEPSCEDQEIQMVMNSGDDSLINLYNKAETPEEKTAIADFVRKNIIPKDTGISDVPQPIISKDDQIFDDDEEDDFDNSGKDLSPAKRSFLSRLFFKEVEVEDDDATNQSEQDLPDDAAEAALSASAAEQATANIDQEDDLLQANTNKRGFFKKKPKSSDNEDIQPAEPADIITENTLYDLNTIEEESYVIDVETPEPEANRESEQPIEQEQPIKQEQPIEQEQSTEPETTAEPEQYAEQNFQDNSNRNTWIKPQEDIAVEQETTIEQDPSITPRYTYQPPTPQKMGLDLPLDTNEPEYNATIFSDNGAIYPQSPYKKQPSTEETPTEKPRWQKLAEQLDETQNTTVTSSDAIMDDILRKVEELEKRLIKEIVPNDSDQQAKK